MHKNRLIIKGTDAEISKALSLLKDNGINVEEIGYEDTDEIFRKNMIRLRKQCKLTKKQLAKETGLPLKLIRDIESGEEYPANKDIPKIAAILVCPISLMYDASHV